MNRCCAAAAGHRDRHPHDRHDRRAAADLGRLPLLHAISSGEGFFLTPRNLWNLIVQTSSIAVMATGMVLVIVMRHIDLSVGSIVGFVSTIVGVTQVYFLPVYLGLDNPMIWILAVVLALARRRRDRRRFMARWSPIPASPPSS